MSNGKKTNNKNTKLKNGGIFIGFAVILCLMVVIVAINISNSDQGVGNDAEGNAISKTETEERKIEIKDTESDNQADTSDVVKDIAENQDETEDTKETAAETSSVKKISEGESLIIPVSEVTTNASFYPVEVEETELEIIAVKDSEGNIRTAFNTCQICYDSGWGYYKQEGDYLVCQNCGNRFTMDEVETESGGCNPWPIFAEDKTVNGDTIEISYDFLKESKEIFANWKSGY